MIDIEKKNQDRQLSTLQFELSKDQLLRATLNEQLTTSRENAYKMELQRDQAQRDLKSKQEFLSNL